MDTILNSASIQTATITINGPTASGTSVNDRFEIRDMRITGASRAKGSNFAGSGILVSSDGTMSNMTFDNVTLTNNTTGIAFSEPLDPMTTLKQVAVYDDIGDL